MGEELLERLDGLEDAEGEEEGCEDGAEVEGVGVQRAREGRELGVQRLRDLG